MKKISTIYIMALCVVGTCLLQHTAVTAQTNVVLPGSFQSELGCSGDWMPDCDITALTFNPITGNWEGTLFIPAGTWEFKVAIDHTWDINYGYDGVLGGPNIWMILPVTTSVSFSFNPVTHLVTSSAPLSAPPNLISFVVLPGSFQSELGCQYDWDPGCDYTGLTYKSGTTEWTGTFHVNAGYSEYKVALNHSWSENYGYAGSINGPNILMYLFRPQDVTFTYDTVTHLVSTSYGCTKGAGYWKTHSHLGPAPADDTWYYVGEYQSFFFSGKTWYEVMSIPNRGNLYYQLARQYVAASLNRFGASIPFQVEQAMQDATFFFYFYTPDSYIDKNYQEYLQNVTTILQHYNEGVTGPGACADVPLSKKYPRAEEAGIKVWPNPANNFFTLSTGSKVKTQLRVFDATGREVFSATTNGNNIRFGENLKPGMYQAELITGDKRSTMKLIKQ